MTNFVECKVVTYDLSEFAMKLDFLFMCIY